MNYLKELICIFFHKIKVIENCSFVDSVTNESVGKYTCEKCNVEYLANSKRDIYRCYIKN